jgi:hypothetical protein
MDDVPAKGARDRLQSSLGASFLGETEPSSHGVEPFIAALGRILGYLGRKTRVAPLRQNGRPYGGLLILGLGVRIVARHLNERPTKLPDSLCRHTDRVLAGKHSTSCRQTAAWNAISICSVTYEFTSFWHAHCLYTARS